MSSILEIKTIVEDYRNKHKGGIMTGINLWEMSVIPSLLNNCGTWNSVDIETMKKLNNLQNTLLRYLLSTPRSTPIPSLPWEFGVLPIKFRIIVKKLCLAKHINSLEEGSLAKEIFETQTNFSFPGLATEVKELLQELNLPDITDKKVCRTYSKTVWKNLVKKSIRQKCENELKQELNEFIKLEKSKISEEQFIAKDYLKTMTLEDARTNFKIRTEMLNLKFNYKHMPQNEKSLWLCDSCQISIESQSHIMWCPAYSELRVGKNINDDKDLIEYVKKVLKIRENLNLTK